MSPSDHNYTYIEKKNALNALLERMRDHDVVGLDTEADSLHHYFEKVCLIQLSLGEDNFIIDPLAGPDLSEFMRELAGKRVVLHGSDYDLRILRSDFDFMPESGIFDTMLAAQILGFEQLGLAALVQHHFGVTLTKQGQKFNWSMRPLPESQLVYASDDTRYLLPLAGKMEEDLRALGREAWHRESCDALVQYTRTDRPPPDSDQVWKIKGLKSFDREQLAFVRCLWHWREREAKESDKPPFKVMGNQLLLGLAAFAAAEPEADLSEGPKLPRTCRGRRRERLIRALRKTRELPKSEWPKHSKRAYTPFMDSEVEKINRLRKYCSKVAGHLKMTPSVIASRASIENMVKARPDSLEDAREKGNLTHWQTELLEEEIRRVFDIS